MPGRGPRPWPALLPPTTLPSTHFEYDRLVTGELVKVRQEGATSGAGVLASYAYDQLGRRMGVTRGNGTVTSYGYDAVSRLASLSHDFAGTGDDVTTTFAYNKASQIALKPPAMFFASMSFRRVGAIRGAQSRLTQRRHLPFAPLCANGRAFQSISDGKAAGERFGARLDR